MIKCGNKKCSKKHDGSFGSGKFCSRGCANSRVFSKESKELKSISAKNSEKVKKSILNNKKLAEERYPKTYRLCKNCGKSFEVKSRYTGKVYCSKVCWDKNKGGYRPKSGRSRSGYYKGVYCGSTYELIWIIYQIDNNIKFDRFEKMLVHGKDKYIPDFIQNNEIVEIKGYLSKNTEKQIKVANACGYKINILTKDKLKKEFNWFRKKYGNIEPYLLYDDYKPKYIYKCSNCGIEFYSGIKKKTTNPCCSRKCSGKFVRNKYRGNYTGNNQYKKRGKIKPH